MAIKRTDSHPSGHFDKLAEQYNCYRTMDEKPVDYLAQRIEGREHTVASLGCGTARYLIGLVRQLNARRVTVKEAVGVDPSAGMLEMARRFASEAGVELHWCEGTAENTGLPDRSVSVVAGFNSFHHFKVKEALAEIERIATRNAYFVVYTRLRAQEREHIWGQCFPGYVDYSVVPRRSDLQELDRINPSFALQESRDFAFARKTTFARLCEQTRNKFYTTLSRYPDELFEQAYETFVDLVQRNHQDLENIRYTSSYSMFIFRVKKTG